MKLNSKYCLFLIAFTGLLSVSLIAQDEQMSYNGKDIAVEYHVTKGMLNGKYVAYYKNGKKKAEGEFQYNNRVGKWDVYDSAGKLKIERVYTNSFVYNQSFPVIPDGPATLLSAPIYKPTRNEEGYYKYSYLQERQVVWSKRTWSYIFNNDNPVLAKDNLLFNLLYKELRNHTVKAYKFKKDADKSFIDTIDFSSTSIDTTGINVIGFITKEDWFYDLDRGQMDCRILGICPIIKKENFTDDSVNIQFLKLNLPSQTGDTLKLFWIYYPEARKYLAKEKVTITDIPYIQNLDDVFFWKYYSSIIFGQSSLHGVGRVNDSWGLIMQTINLEHDTWLGMSLYN